MRILFTTVALPGHFFPLVPLAWACRTLGHEVLVTCADEFVPTVLGAGLPAASSGPGARFADLVADDRPSSGLTEQRAAHGRAFGKMAVRSLPGTMAVTRFWQPDVVVSERAEFAGPVAAYAAGLPRVELHWGVAPLPEYRTGAATELSTALTMLGLDALPTPGTYVNPWPPGLRLPHATHHHGIRAVPQYNGQAPIPDWLLRPPRARRVCLTLGTVVPRSGRSQVAESVTDIIAALARLDVELVVAVDDRVAAGWGPLPSAVRHAGRMPLAQVFATCDVAIHHGGQGTALTALGAAVPQLLLPVFDDQFDNSDSVARAGAGIRLLPDAITPAAIAGHCVELLERPAYREAATAAAARIAEQPSPVDVAALVARAGGILRAAA